MTQESTPITSNYLKYLVENFCSQEPDSREWTIAAYRLITTVQNLPNLSKDRSQVTAQDSEEILNETLAELIQRICYEFQPDGTDYIQSLKNWINGKLRLYYKPKDRLRKARRHKTLSLDRYISNEENATFLDLLETNPNEVTLNSIDGLIEQAQQAHRKRVGLAVWQYLEEDPDNRLKDCCSQKYPDCNCYLLVQKRLLSDPPVAFQAIADELGISFGTLTGHWAKKCKPLLVEIAQEIEQKLQEEI